MKGDMRNNPRGGTIINFKSTIGDGFGLTKEMVLNGFRDSMSTFRLLAEDTCFKKSKGASQI